MSLNILGPCPDKKCCPKKKIMREEYSVKPKCIKNKGTTLIINLLEKYNYKLKNNFDDRIKSLKKANKELSKLNVLRYINALRTLHKSNEKYYRKLDRDMKWLQENYN
jgi:hypothetical protein